MWFRYPLSLLFEEKDSCVIVSSSWQAFWHLVDHQEITLVSRLMQCFFFFYFTRWYLHIVLKKRKKHDTVRREKQASPSPSVLCRGYYHVLCIDRIEIDTDN